jgi:hypothetical protein
MVYVFLRSGYEQVLLKTKCNLGPVLSVEIRKEEHIIMKLHSNKLLVALSFTVLFSVTALAGQRSDKGTEQTRKERREAKKQERENKKEAKAQRMAHL